ncbi:flagellar basal-body MS-ring/collar protein FliF [Iodidimonas sp. SYSU 1G8]|uniref:flagellar basal-body MS-ring/collar protein FliF n=1 Tax=Iodidimonas sp. SYSU 1G8 TaxID=3133967 RepID=UPI0031FF1A6F
MGGVALTLLVVIGLVAFRGSEPEMGFLFTDLDPSSAQSITQKLAAQNVPYQISADGAAIMAPRERLAELRMGLAGERVGAKMGYEVLDAEEPFGVSASRAKMNETRAIEGELARSIESLDQVAGARVHIVMPERALFSAEARKATASITLKTQGRLPGSAIEAIRYLVSSAVPELSPESVSIIDQNGTLLARAGEGSQVSGSQLEERQAALEARMRAEVESLLEPIVGAGKARVEVAIALDRSSTQEETETYDPDAQVIARQISVDSSDQSNENEPGARAASVASQLPENQDQPGEAGKNSRLAARKETSEDVTYQNSRTRKVSQEAPGKISRLSVAVMLDGGPKGLPEAQVKRLTRLVENAVGADAGRGDSVIVESMAFAAAPDVDAALGGLPLGITMDQIFSALKLLIISATGLIALMMLRSRLGLGPAQTTPAQAMAPTLLTAQPELAALTARAEAGDPQAVQQLQAMRSEQSDIPRGEDVILAQVDGGVRLSALTQVGDVVASSPAEATALIRQWMAA